MSCFQTEIRPHDSENKRRASQETGAESSKKKVKVIDIRHSSSEVHQENKSFGKLDWNYLNLTPPPVPLGKRFPTSNPPSPPLPILKALTGLSKFFASYVRCLTIGRQYSD